MHINEILIHVLVDIINEKDMTSAPLKIDILIAYYKNIELSFSKLCS